MFFGRDVRIRVFLRTLNFKISVVCLSHSERVSVLDPAKTTVLSPYLTTTYNLQKYLYNFIFYKIFQRFTPNVQMKRIYTSLGIYSGTAKYPVLGKFWIRFLNRHLVQRGSLFSRRCTMKALESGKKQLNYSLLPITCC